MINLKQIIAVTLTATAVAAIRKKLPTITMTAKLMFRM